jgi:hypothetical protein
LHRGRVGQRLDDPTQDLCCLAPVALRRHLVRIAPQSKTARSGTADGVSCAGMRTRLVCDLVRVLSRALRLDHGNRLVRGLLAEERLVMLYLPQGAQLVRGAWALARVLRGVVS